MNDEVNDQTAVDGEDTTQAVEDPIKNLKAEYSRKLENVNNELVQQRVAMEQILNAINSRQAAPAQPQAKLSDLVYNDPERAAEIIEARAVEKATQIVDSRMKQTQAAQAVITKMASDYPELNDEASELRLQALSIYAKLDQSTKNSPEGYRIAIREAAAELGVLPASKRAKKTSNADDFSMPATGAAGAKNRQARQPELDSNTLALAEAMNLNIKDPKIVDRLKQRAQRKNWNRYE